MVAMRMAIQKASGRPKSRADGFIVVAVLWILAALGALISVYAVYVVDTTATFAANDDQLSADALVSAAMELVAYRQLSTAAQAPPSHGSFKVRLGSANMNVEYVSEAARIDLNSAQKPLIAGFFVVLGASPSDADIYADRVVSWRTAPSQNNNSEAAAYRDARLDYGPRGAKFPHVSELSLVRGLPQWLVERAIPFVTVYSGRPQVNVLDATPEVLASLPGMNRERLTAVLRQRQAEPDNVKSVLALFGQAQQFVTGDASRAFRIYIRIAFDNGRNAAAETIILILDGDDEPFAVLSWHDDRDELR
jgi:general secretion pathway protein K